MTITFQNSMHLPVGAIFKRLPLHLRQDLERIPGAGSGVHRWLYVMALKLHVHLPPANIYCLLRHAPRIGDICKMWRGYFESRRSHRMTAGFNNTGVNIPKSVK